MRDFNMKNMFAYEPNLSFCTLGRSLNPYMTFLTGEYLPPVPLQGEFLDLIVAWSIYSHLSEFSAALWLSETARLLKIGGFCVCTTWGVRFLKRLTYESKLAESGQPIHWYSKVCIDAMGSIEGAIKIFEDTGFLWFTSGKSILYGEAFISKEGLERIIFSRQIPLKIISFDCESLSQDVFILQRTENY
jgi:hypothetical protein